MPRTSTKSVTMSEAKTRKTKRMPPLNLRTDSNAIVEQGKVSDNACFVYDVQNTTKQIDFPDEQKSIAVERVVHIPKTKGGKPLFTDNKKNLEHEYDGNFRDKHDEHCENMCQNNYFS